MHRLRTAFFLLFAIGLLGASFFLGAYTGYHGRPEIEKVIGVLNHEPNIVIQQEVDFASFWKAWNALEEKFTSNDGFDRQQMIWGAIAGMARSLDDPYTVFFPPAEKKIFEEDIRGDFGGVGMEIGIRKGKLTVIAPLKNSPAARAGIMAGDKVFKIDDTDTADLTIEEAVQLIRGPKGTEVKLTIFREKNDGTEVIKIIRDTIQIPTIETETRGDIFLIRLFSFSEKSPALFQDALRKMIEQNHQALILDLRNNPGGFLEASVEIASWFLPVGKVVARERFRSGEERLHRSKGYNIFNRLPFVVIVNNGSASASEILAGALQEHDIATLIGTTTFGKGSVQELVPITDETSLKVTIARWLTPNGNTISEKGLTPDIIVEQDAKDTENLVDTALERATAVVKEKQAERQREITQ